MSRAFRFLLAAREQLYRKGLFQTRRLNYPVVSVGNLTLGGTGKTPLTIALAERFLKEGFRPVVLSRGYKRSSKGPLIVSRGQGPLVPWNEAGDEPFLIARRVQGASVVVGADRYQAGRLAEREGLGDLFLLDDGFQHRGLFRNVDLVTIDPVEWMGEDRLLPRGRWREPKSAIGRADAACVQQREGISFPELPIPAFAVTTAIDGIFQDNQRVDLQSLRGQPVVALAGIAKPERFFSALENLGIIISRRIEFRDHHKYSERDVGDITAERACELRITTEKDSVRLEDTLLANFLHLRISANIPEFDRLMELIRNRLS